MSLTRSGYLTGETPEIKKELTVRAVVNTEFGFPPPPFKVFRKTKTGLCVPRFYGEEKFGKAKEDRRPKPVKISCKFNGKLRDETHQNDALAAALKSGHGVLSLPCGFGKTTVSLAIACKLGYRTMIVVHKEFLANQWKERIQQFCPGASIGVVQQNKLETDCDFVIAMLQSLSLKEYSFNDFDTIGTLIVDEAHHICAKVFSQSLFKICPKHIFGLSATPTRKDGLTKVLHWFMGPTFFAIERENQEQVEVFPIEYRCPRFQDPPPCTRFGKLSLATMITELTEDRGRNIVIANLIKNIVKGTRQVLVLSDRRHHCEVLHQSFKKTSGLYMGGMKEADLPNQVKNKSYLRRLVKHTKVSIYLHSIRLYLRPLSLILYNRLDELCAKRMVKRTIHIFTTCSINGLYVTPCIINVSKCIAKVVLKYQNKNPKNLRFH